MSSLVNANKFNMAMNFFAQKNLVNILSSPKIVVMDNQAASINVGTEVPVLNSSTTTTSSITTDQQLSQSVEYRQTGIILNVTPTIHSGDSLMLQISQVVSDAQENDVSAISSPMILTRDISTSVVLNSEQTMMLGGLIRENKSITDTKVPILGDIPFIKHFFSSSNDSINKTELIILIKPTILNSEEESNSITNSFKNLLNHNTVE
jgi:general secretion pathway protein D